MSSAWLELYDLQTCRCFYINQLTGDWSKDRPNQVPIVKTQPDSVWSIWNEEARTTLYYHSKTRQWAHKPLSHYPVVSLSSFGKNSSLQRYLGLPSAANAILNQQLDLSKQENGSTTVMGEHDQDHTNEHNATIGNVDRNAFTPSPKKLRHADTTQRPVFPKLKKQGSLLQSLKKRLTISLPPLSIVNHDPTLTNATGTSRAYLHRPCTSPKNQAPRIPIVAPLSPPWPPSPTSPSSSSSSSSFSHVFPISTLPSPITPVSPFIPSSDNKNESSNDKTYTFEDYAANHFTIHKQAFFRRTPISLADMLAWTKNSINKPLLRSTNKKYTKDAITCFKKIQKVMNDRPRKYHGRTCACDDVTDIQLILLCGITNGQEFRDEIYVQLCKQLNHNPTSSSIQKGWELFSVLCSTIPPSEELTIYLIQFIHDHLVTVTKLSSSNDDDGENDNNAGSSLIGSYLRLKLNRICQHGTREDVPGRAEIQLARMAVLQQQIETNHDMESRTTSSLMFGTPLTAIMKHQQQQQSMIATSTSTATTTGNAGNHFKIPLIVPFLVNAICQLQGHATQGIFRVPGLADLVTSLRIHIENGCDMRALDLSICCGDPNVPASLLRLWLRQLPSPLIPVDVYDTCIDKASDLNAVMGIVNSLPEVNRRILLYLIGFIQEFLTPEVCQLTLMTVNNLAMVFAPNFLRGPLTDDLELALQKSKYEQLFVMTLLLGPKVDMDLQLYG